MAKQGQLKARVIPLIPPIQLLYGLAPLVLCASIWLRNVSQIVPEPYLDEEFHVRQAQVYCAGHWKIWDPKITTPPGLYSFSALLDRAFGGSRCSISDLRLLNAVVCCVGIPVVACSIIRQHINIRYPNTSPKSVNAYASHSAVNAGLFPLLFFFSALYYTDVMSTFWVLVSHAIFLSKAQVGGTMQQSVIKDAFMVGSGVIALSLRQTNIFWVAIFHGCLEVLRTLETKRAGYGQAYSTSSVGSREVVAKSWHNSVLYDPPAGEAYVEDYIKFGISLVVASLANVQAVIRALVPYLLLLGSFAAFIVWNGGVVLGDKSNHVATPHLTQMLYIWPCFVFFFPWTLLNSATQSVIPRKRWPRLLQVMSDKAFAKDDRSNRPRLLVLCMATAIAGLIVHFNTIIHPFTLADNRHYVFYAFRWTILRHHLIKYLFAPVYALSGWAVLSSFNSPSQGTIQRASASTRTSVADNQEDGSRCSFVIVWLLSTALSLVTAPLVEPRYFILPLIMWRLSLPPSALGVDPNATQRTTARGTPSANSSRSLSETSKWAVFLRQRNVLLWLESFWFIFINLATGYIFLYKGFSWPQEPGKIQRFMW